MYSLFSWLMQGPPPKSPALQAAERDLSPALLHDLRGHFYAVLQRRRRQLAAQQHHSDHHRKHQQTLDGLDREAFVAELCGLRGLDATVADRLFDAVRAGRPLVNEESVVLAKYRLERCGQEAALEFCFALMAGGADAGGAAAASERAPLQVFERFVLACFQLAQLAHPEAGTGRGREGSEAPSLQLQQQQQVCLAAICAGAKTAAALGSSAQSYHHATSTPGASVPFSRPDTKGSPLPLPEEGLTLAQYCTWTKTCPAVQHVLSSLLLAVGSPPSPPAVEHPPDAGKGPGHSHQPGIGSSSPLPLRLPPALASKLTLPSLCVSPSYGSIDLLLQPLWAWLLSHEAPAACRREWSLLFNSDKDGRSFNTFTARLAAAPGPTLLLVRDKGGAVFGGFASQAWRRCGTFYGDDACFLFTLLPAARMYPATGINANYQVRYTGSSSTVAGCYLWRY